MAEINYWSLTNDDLARQFHRRELDGDPDEMSRRAVIEAIKKWDAENPDKATDTQATYVATQVDGNESIGNNPSVEKVKLAPDGKPLRKFKEPMMLVVFHYKNDDDPAVVQLGLNGMCLNVPRDREVLIPQKFLDVIEHAKEVKTMRATDPDTGKRRNVTRIVPRLSYTVLARNIK